MSTSDYTRTLETWAQEGARWAEALLVQAQHSSPLPPGARLAVDDRGRMAGAISMGCVESDLREHLLATVRDGQARLLHYGAAHDMVFEVGLSCGGEIDVLLRRQEPDEVWRALSGRDPARPSLLMTAVDPPYAGRQLWVDAEGTAVGALGDPALECAAREEAARLWRRGGSLLVRHGTGRVFAELLEPPPRLAVVGASPIAEALCRMAAAAGFDVALVDPRRTYARAESFPDARSVVHAWPEEGFAALGVAAGWYVAVLAHDEKLDVPALAAALRAGCRYIGLLGSRGTQEKRKSALRGMGFSEADLARLSGPIGLRIGALTPAEIAVAILAEMIGRRRNAD